MAAIPPVKIDRAEWLLLRQLSYEEFMLWLTDVEDIGLYMARRRLRLRFPKEFPTMGANHHA